ncbi:uncharacterized protein HD556DRAFT_1424645 [Suillus plorans]|uniref:Uncharacterized protein n=1 Tax=Suillus plorans TaxID=116603 RepID=A0A9P7AAK4_9AGAM|nr:uncharacterized protein HD556DRAFT_1424645 [Suillus plorans]KAG1785128.1 hypothetical protein HD556DRAFT_1424645 [Suillus plorans]
MRFSSAIVLAVNVVALASSISAIPTTGDAASADTCFRACTSAWQVFLFFCVVSRIFAFTSAEYGY